MKYNSSPLQCIWKPTGLSWSAALANTTTASDCQTPSGQIPGDESDEQGIDGYGGKDFEKVKVLRREWKTPWENSATSPWSEPDDGEELGDDDAPDW